MPFFKSVNNMLNIMPIGIHWLEHSNGTIIMVKEILRFNLGWIALRCNLVTHGCAMSAINFSSWSSIACINLLELTKQSRESTCNCLGFSQSTRTQLAAKYI